LAAGRKKRARVHFDCEKCGSASFHCGPARGRGEFDDEIVVIFARLFCVDVLICEASSAGTHRSREHSTADLLVSSAGRSVAQCAVVLLLFKRCTYCTSD
jgi:hypothetical protein